MNNPALTENVITFMKKLLFCAVISICSTEKNNASPFPNLVSPFGSHYFLNIIEVCPSTHDQFLPENSSHIYDTVSTFAWLSYEIFVEYFESLIQVD